MGAGLRPLVAMGRVWPIAAVGLPHLDPVGLDGVPLIVVNRSPSQGGPLGEALREVATQGAAAAWSH